MIRLPALLIVIGIIGTALLNEAPIAAATSVAHDSRPAPLGYREFCRAHVDLCFIDDQVPAPISNDDLAAVLRINSEVNRSIIYMARDDSDPWDLMPALGDCDDFAASKLARLIEYGIPRQNLKFAMVITETDEVHLVLLLRVPDAGDLVLDNRTGRIVLSSQTPYRFIAEEWLWGDDMGTWRSVEGVVR